LHLPKVRGLPAVVRPATVARTHTQPNDGSYKPLPRAKGEKAGIFNILAI